MTTDEDPSKLAEILRAREKKAIYSALAEGRYLGIRSAWLACYRIHAAHNMSNHERSDGAMECMDAIDRLLKEAEAGR